MRMARYTVHLKHDWGVPLFGTPSVDTASDTARTTAIRCAHLSPAFPSNAKDVECPLAAAA